MRKSMTAVLVLLCSIGLTSCTAITVDKLPQPGDAYRGGYDIVIEFANVLNLPDRARVVMDGTRVGVVERVNVAKGRVDVTARIDPSVKVPGNINAVLQQATVLGDIYVALDRVSGASQSTAALAPGAHVPLSQTTSPPSLEDTLASLATFVGRGPIQRIQNTIIGINRVTPERSDQIRALVSRVSTDFADLAANIDTVDQGLQSVARTTDVLAQRSPQLRHWLTPEAYQAAYRVSVVLRFVSTLLPSLGTIYCGGFWLAPLLNSLATATGEVQQSKRAIEGEYRPWRKLFTEMFLPQDKYPAMNITSVQTADGREISGNVQDVLRMLGAVP
ncbi:MlaD family protein [Mycolicibacterium sp.]|uniref:MlaD family protein n=1 Tax=Mycolicibacterium sp. TaxID=2320850 RepID=UPI0025D1A67D|nr:MlaD family protein [Mycolicibacterium sp.]